MKKEFPFEKPFAFLFAVFPWATAADCVVWRNDRNATVNVVRLGNGLALVMEVPSDRSSVRVNFASDTISLSRQPTRTPSVKPMTIDVELPDDEIHGLIGEWAVKVKKMDWASKPAFIPVFLEDDLRDPKDGEIVVPAAKPIVGGPNHVLVSESLRAAWVPEPEGPFWLAVDGSLGKVRRGFGQFEPEELTPAFHLGGVRK